jgi:hypothetical protein
VGDEAMLGQRRRQPPVKDVVDPNKQDPGHGWKRR